MWDDGLREEVEAEFEPLQPSAQELMERRARWIGWLLDRGLSRLEPESGWISGHCGACGARIEGRARRFCDGDCRLEASLERKRLRRARRRS